MKDFTRKLIENLDAVFTVLTGGDFLTQYGCECGHGRRWHTRLKQSPDRAGLWWPPGAGARPATAPVTERCFLVADALTASTSIASRKSTGCRTGRCVSSACARSTNYLRLRR